MNLHTGHFKTLQQLLVVSLSIFAVFFLSLNQASASRRKTQHSFLKAKPVEWIIKFKSADFIGKNLGALLKFESENLTEDMIVLKSSKNPAHLFSVDDVEYIQPNYKINLLEKYKVEDSLRRAALIKLYSKQPRSENRGFLFPDNPAIPDAPASASGDDPLLAKQWGMGDIGVKDSWSVTQGNPEMIVAVIDTGVDYTHEDLLPNIWRNSGETGLDSAGKNKSTNGIDDDENGYVDDVIGWDFAANDNLPYDLSSEPIDLIKGAGNPGHGTHCAGNVAAAAGNGKGTAGVAPKVKIMSLRFISEKGQGTTADAIKAIRYAIKMGAKITSNSWGSEGEDSAEQAQNKALRDTIAFAESKGVLFIAAAGNGHQGKGYDNDSDPKPAYPASYANDIIISVAALDVKNKLGAFSNWGKKSVDLAAPGVDVFSTTVGSNYSNVVLDFFGFTQTWDGTSMAAPHVAGAAALYWSAYPQKTWAEVKTAILDSVTKLPDYEAKLVSGGKLNVKKLMQK